MTRCPLAVLAAAVLAGAALAPPAVGAPAIAAVADDPAAGDVREWVLPNGLRVMAVDAPAPAAWLFVPAGWGADAADSRGASELVAATVTAATQDSDVRALRTALHEVGASLSAAIAADHAVLGLATTDAPHLGSALPLLAEVAIRPSFPPAAMDASCAALLQGLLDAQRDPMAALERIVPATFAGLDMPAAGLPDPWLVRTQAAARAAAFHAEHWRPRGSVLAVSGLEPATLRAVVDEAFSSWAGPAAGSPPPDAPPARTPDAPPTTPLVECATQGSAAAVAVALAAPDAGDAPGTLARHALLGVLASRLGATDRLGAPLPARGHDALLLPVTGSPGRELGRLRREIDALVADGPTPAELRAWHARFLALEDAARAADPSRAAYVAGLARFRGLDPAIVTRPPEPSPADVRLVAAELQASAGIRFAVAGPARLLSRVREASARPCTLSGPRDGAGAEASARGADLVRRALAAQGDPQRLAALSVVDERAEGMFHGIGTHVAVRTRTLLSLPSLAYVESVMYNHRRFIANRLVNGEVWVDRTGIGTRVEHRFDKARLLERQSLAHPAFTLSRLAGGSWLRHAGPGPDPGTQAVDALHPVLGQCRLVFRTEDLTLVALEVDLRPLDPSTEVHRFADFRVVDGIRMPHADSTMAADRPLRDIRVTEVSFPASVDPAFFLTAATPDPDTFTRPGPPDGAAEPPLAPE